MEKYDVAIIGGGVIGTAETYILSKYSNLERIALIEKEPGWGKINSASTSNSQTLHRGRIETNYNEAKTTQVNQDAGWLVGYIDRHPSIGKISTEMVMGVGKAEVAELHERYNWAKEIFPGIQLLDYDKIAEVEPNVIAGRNSEPIIALYFDNGYTVDYAKLSASFVKEANAQNKTLDEYLGNKVKKIKRKDGEFHIQLHNQTISAKAVLVSAGSYSLKFAQDLGYGKNLIQLPIAGSFYYTPSVLNGKVYTVQKEGLPFAAVHGDPDIAVEGKTRFGPTAIFLPIMERGDWWSSIKYIQTFQNIPKLRKALCTLAKILKDDNLVSFMKENLRYLGPKGNQAFLPNVQKIIPSLRIEDLVKAKDTHGNVIGGIRPQVVNIQTKQLLMGEVNIKGENILFNITPSPGASVCLANARESAMQLHKFLPDFRYDDGAFKKDHMPFE